MPAGDRVIHTSILIAYLEPTDGTHDVAVVLIDDLVRSGRNSAVVSMVTVMELLVQPLRFALYFVATIKGDRVVIGRARRRRWRQ